MNIFIPGSGVGFGCIHKNTKNKSKIIIAPVLDISCMADYFLNEYLDVCALALLYAL